MGPFFQQFKHNLKQKVLALILKHTSWNLGFGKKERLIRKFQLGDYEKLKLLGHVDNSHFIAFIMLIHSL